MNLKLNEWNEACKHSEIVCNDLNSKGYNVKSKPYAMYDGRKGLNLQVFDNNGKFFTEYSSGIYSNLCDIKRSINNIAKRIVAEV